MIVVYPQAAATPHVGKGCWNWDSYTYDPWFDTRWGMQLGTVANLLRDLPRALKGLQAFSNGTMPAEAAAEDAAAAE